MEFYLDTCEVEEVRKAVETKHISGVTTNPTLAKKAYRRDYQRIIKEMCRVFAEKKLPASISAQVKENSTAKKMIDEGVHLSLIDHERVVIKVPPTRAGFEAIRGLKSHKIRTNVTLIFDSWQAVRAMEAGADFISPFLGRKEGAKTDQYIQEEIKRIYGGKLDQYDKEKIENTKEIWRNHSSSDARTSVAVMLTKIMYFRDIRRFPTKILAASIREKEHVVMANECLADIATVSPEIFWRLIDDDFRILYEDELCLTQKGIDTFLEDRKFLTSVIWPNFQSI